MRRIITSLGVVAAVLVLVAPNAAAHNNGWAFASIDVKRRQVGLRWVFNRSFPDFGPHEVRCRGLDPATLRNGARGYRHIRCSIESMVVPDFIYHLDAKGNMFATRAWG